MVGILLINSCPITYHILGQTWSAPGKLCRKHTKPPLGNNEWPEVRQERNRIELSLETDVAGGLHRSLPPAPRSHRTGGQMWRCCQGDPVPLTTSPHQHPPPTIKLTHTVWHWLCLHGTKQFVVEWKKLSLLHIWLAGWLCWCQRNKHNLLVLHCRALQSDKHSQVNKNNITKRLSHPRGIPFYHASKPSFPIMNVCSFGFSKSGFLPLALPTAAHSPLAQATHCCPQPALCFALGTDRAWGALCQRPWARPHFAESSFSDMEGGSLEGNNKDNRAS